MSKIKIFALGGLNEIGKNMYVVEVDKDIFILSIILLLIITYGFPEISFNISSYIFSYSEFNSSSNFLSVIIRRICPD